MRPRKSGLPIYLQYARRKSPQVIRKTCRQVDFVAVWGTPTAVTAIPLATSHLFVAIDSAGRVTVYDMNGDGNAVFALDSGSHEVSYGGKPTSKTC